MEPSRGWGGAGGSTKSAPLTGISSRPLLGNTEEAPLQVTLVCPPQPRCLSPALGTPRGGEGVAGAAPAPTFLLSQPLLQSWAGASTSIFKSHSADEEARGVRGQASQPAGEKTC